MPGLYDGTSGLWGGFSGLWDGLYGLGSTTPPVVLGGFDPSFNSTSLVYDEDDRLVYRTDAAGRRAVRSQTSHATGKWYIELMPIVSRLRFGGAVDSTFSLTGAGGAAGTNRVGVQAQRLVGFGADVPAGQFANPGDIIRIACNIDTDRLWLKFNNGNWNNIPAADPQTGVGGLSTSGLIGSTYIGVTLRPVVNAGIRIRLPGDLGYELPMGYSEWSS